MGVLRAISRTAGAQVKNISGLGNKGIRIIGLFLQGGGS